MVAGTLLTIKNQGDALLGHAPVNRFKLLLTFCAAAPVNRFKLL